MIHSWVIGFKKTTYEKTFLFVKQINPKGVFLTAPVQFSKDNFIKYIFLTYHGDFFLLINYELVS